MKLLVFGATGGAGRHVVEKALAAGHEVTAFVRTPAAMKIEHDGLRIIQGDSTDGEGVAEAIEGHDAVISAVGPRPGSPPGTLISATTRNIVQGMQRHAVRRLVHTSGLMVGAARGMNPLQRAAVSVYRAMNRALFLDKVVAEKLVTDSAAEWVIVRPPEFGDVPARGAHRLGVDLDVKLTKMSSADVADALLAALLDDRHQRQILELSY